MKINIHDIKARVDKHDTDLYWGNGKPGLKTRVELLEDFKMEVKEQFKRVNAALNWAIGLLIATLAAVIVDITVKK